MYLHLHFSSSPRVKPIGRYWQSDDYHRAGGYWVVRVRLAEDSMAEGRTIYRKGEEIDQRATALYPRRRVSKLGRITLEGGYDIMAIPEIARPV